MDYLPKRRKRRDRLFSTYICCWFVEQKLGWVVGRKRWIAEITNQSCQLNGVSWFGNVAKWFLLIPNCCFKILCAKCLFFPSICCDTKQFRHPPTIVLTITVFECVTVRFIKISEVNGETKLNRYHYDNY